MSYFLKYMKLTGFVNNFECGPRKYIIIMQSPVKHPIINKQQIVANVTTQVAIKYFKITMVEMIYNSKRGEFSSSFS